MLVYFLFFLSTMLCLSELSVFHACAADLKASFREFLLVLQEQRNMTPMEILVEEVCVKGPFSGLLVKGAGEGTKECCRLALYDVRSRPCFFSHVLLSLPDAGLSPQPMHSPNYLRARVQIPGLFDGHGRDSVSKCMTRVHHEEVLGDTNLCLMFRDSDTSRPSFDPLDFKNLFDSLARVKKSETLTGLLSSPSLSLSLTHSLSHTLPLSSFLNPRVFFLAMCVAWLDSLHRGPGVCHLQSSARRAGPTGLPRDARRSGEL